LPGAAARAAAPALPDLPTGDEASLLAALHASRPGDPAPARALGEYYRSEGRPASALWACSFAPAGALAAEPEIAAIVGQALADARFPAAAIERLRASAARAPGRAATIVPLAELLLRTGQPQEALAVLPGCSAPLLEGRVFQATGDLAGAESAYRRAADGGDTEGWRRLGLLLEARGQRESARRMLGRARDAEMTNGAIVVDLARVTAAGGAAADRAAAMKLYRQAVRLDAAAPAYTDSSRIPIAEKQWVVAAEGLSRAVAADPGYAPAQKALAEVAERLGRRAEAHYRRGLYYSIRDLRARSLREYLALAEVDPSRPDGLLMASQAAHKMFHKQQARELARRAWQRFPEDRQVREQFLSLLVLSQNRGEAIGLCEAWRRNDPEALAPLWMLARVAQAQRRFEDAVRFHEEALAKAPENPAALESLGSALLEAPGGADLERAVDLLARAASLKPESAATRYQLGVALMRQGRLEEAQRQLLRCLDLDPNRGEAYNLLVQLSRRLRQPGAVALFGGLVRDVEERLRVELRLWRQTWDRPEDAEGFVALAGFLVASGDLSKAESQLEEALRLRPGHTRARGELARVRRLLAVCDSRRSRS
jgi:tetratricopeptide (TPR) repeat protein